MQNGRNKLELGNEQTERGKPGRSGYNPLKRPPQGGNIELGGFLMNIHTRTGMKANCILGDGRMVREKTVGMATHGLPPCSNTGNQAAPQPWCANWRPSKRSGKYRTRQQKHEKGKTSDKGANGNISRTPIRYVGREMIKISRIKPRGRIHGRNGSEYGYTSGRPSPLYIN